MMKQIIVGLIVIIVSALIVTYAALEAGGVIEIETQDQAKQPRFTHIWHVNHENRILIEAGHPANPWVGDLRNYHQIAVTGDNLNGRYTFTIHHDVQSHELIRGLMRRRYGWRDWWVGLLFDTSQSAIIELFPIQE